jgi:type I restriction enzyme S subunit
VGLRGFKPYPAYKESRAEWLGKIPSHWKAKRLKYVAPLTDERSYAETSNLPYIGLEHIESQTGRLVSTSENDNKEDEDAESAVSLFQPGDVLFGKLRPYLAKVIRPEFEGRCSTELLVLRSAGDIAPSFLAYQLLSRDFISWVDAMTYGTKMPRASPEQVSNIPVALAPSQEQRAIAAFLDRETAKIDALVAKKERLIELLQEERTAVIARAVTKGLDPSVPMSDSGIDWLGENPAHWKVIPLKRIASIRYGLGEPPQLLADGLPFIRATNVSKGRIIDQEMQFVDPSDVPWNRDPTLRSDDIIVVRSGAYTGDSAIIPREYDGAISGYDMVVRPRRCVASFLAWVLLSRFVLEAQIELESMRAAQPHLNAEELGAVVILLPPDSEQRAIAAFLGQETVRIDSLAAKVRVAIDRLKELRSALISAAVTGKIDVREEST